MTSELVIALASTGAAVVAALAAWFSYRVLLRRPEIVADLLVNGPTLDLVVRNIGNGAAYEVAFTHDELPLNVLPEFRKSSLLRFGLSVLAPGREYRVPLISLDEAQWGKGLEFEIPLVLVVKHRQRLLVVRRWRKERFELGLGAFSDMRFVGSRAEFIEF